MAARGDALPRWVIAVAVCVLLVALPIMVLAVFPDRPTRTTRSGPPPPQPVYVPPDTSEVPEEPSGARILHGAVTDENGTAVAGAELRIAGGAKAKSGADGSWHMNAVGLDALELVVRADGYLEERVAVPPGPAGEDREVTVSLTAAAAVSGIVVDHEGQPVGKANVSCTDRSDDPELSFTTDLDGRFELPTRAAGCQAVAIHYDFEPSAAKELVAGDKNRLELGAPGSISGVVTDEGGAPVPHFVLAVESFQPAHGEARGRMGSSKVFDDASGRFKLESLQSGSYVLTVSASAHPPVQSDAIEVGTAEDVRGVRITLRRGALLEGRITDAKTGQPVEGARVVLDSVTMTRADAVGVGHADAQGHYELDGVPAGPFSIRVTAGGYGSRVIAGITSRGKKTITENVELTPGAEEEGTEFSGIGAQLAAQPQGIMIARVIPGGGAEAAGLERGDIILRIDGEDAKGISMPEAIQKLRGPEGSRVRVRVQREGGGEVEVMIERKTFKR
jgi:carboxypeptidase family protein/PDZ domain-containing protein